MTERMALLFGLDSSVSLSYSALKNAWHSSSEGLRSQRGPGTWTWDWLWEKPMLQISSYLTPLTEFSFVSDQTQDVSVQTFPFLISAAASTAYRSAAACEQTSPSPGLQVQWPMSTVPSSCTVIKGCVGVTKILRVLHLRFETQIANFKLTNIAWLACGSKF